MAFSNRGCCPAWSGAHGYEGFLVDNYYALLAVLDRAGMIAKLP